MGELLKQPTSDIGFNANTGEYVHMIQAGIMDPTKGWKYVEHTPTPSSPYPHSLPPYVHLSLSPPRFSFLTFLSPPHPAFSFSFLIVTRQALLDAFSVSGLLMTTEAMVAGD